MFKRNAAWPLALGVSLFLLPACDGDDGDSSATATDGTSTGGTTTGPATTTDPGTSGSESGEESSSEGSAGESSTGETAIGYADLAGDYIEPFPGGMATHALTPTSWTTDYGDSPIEQSVAQVDDDAQWVVLEDGTGAFSRNDWAFDGDGNLRYCAAVFGAASAEAAAEAPVSDAGDFDGVGCGGMFPWSLLEPAE